MVVTTPSSTPACHHCQRTCHEWQLPRCRLISHKTCKSWSPFLYQVFRPRLYQARYSEKYVVSLDDMQYLHSASGENICCFIGRRLSSFSIKVVPGLLPPRFLRIRTPSWIRLSMPLPRSRSWGWTAGPAAVLPGAYGTRITHICSTT